jgi:repressor LexA
MPSRGAGRAVEVPMLGFVAAGAPIEAVPGAESIAIPESLVSGKRDTYVLRVKGDSMIDEQIRDGDWVVIEDRKSADNGEMVIALVGGEDATLKKFYKENGRVRLQPANPTLQPIFVDPDTVQIQGVVVGIMRKY